MNIEIEKFSVHGHYTVSNAGGYEIMLSNCGELAKIRDCFGGRKKVSEWLPIEWLQSEESRDYEPIIDPNGYNIPLSQVLKATNP